MGSDTDYRNYKADQLLNDTYFLESEQHPTPESIAFWEKLSQENEQVGKEIAIARKFLHNLRHLPAPRLPQQEVDRIWQQIDGRNHRERNSKRKRLILLRTLAAACVALLLVGGWYLRHALQTSGETGLPDITAFDKPATPTDNIRLVLSEEKQIAIEGKEGQLHYDPQGKVNVNSQTIDLTAEKKSAYNQLIVPAGKRSSITFSDGTRLWLSANSRVVYPTEFMKAKREIYVEGEVFLDVKPDPDRPFIVKTDKIAVQVLGTTFNVRAYEQEETQTVVLVTGKVEVKNKNNETQTLSPHNLLAYSEQEGFSIHPVEVDTYIAWKDGFYLFRQESLEIIAKRLTGYYGKIIEVDKPLKSITFSGKLDLKEELDHVLHTLIQTIPAEIKKAEGKIYILGKEEKEIRGTKKSQARASALTP